MGQLRIRVQGFQGWNGLVIGGHEIVLRENLGLISKEVTTSLTNSCSFKILIGFCGPMRNLKLIVRACFEFLDRKRYCGPEVGLKYFLTFEVFINF